MRAAKEEEVRIQKLQAELDQARANAGKVFSHHKYNHQVQSPSSIINDQVQSSSIIILLDRVRKGEAVERAAQTMKAGPPSGAWQIIKHIGKIYQIRWKNFIKN